MIDNSTHANTAYISNKVCYGSIGPQAIKRGGWGGKAQTDVATLTVEDFTVNRAVNKVTQGNEVMGPGGFAMSNAQEDGSCVIQTGSVSTKQPKNGDWFEVEVDTDIGTERWVIGPISRPYNQNGVWKCNATITRDHFRTTS